MHRYLRILFFNLIVLALAGLVMRAMPIYALPSINFEHLKHAHSHLAFLGWVFGAFYLAFIHAFLPANTLQTSKKYRQLFWLIQISVAGMFIAFLLDGYGAAAIVFLTFHTILAYFFFAYFFKDAKGASPTSDDGASFAFAKVAFLCFLLSSLAPFFIPPAKMLGDGNPNHMQMLIAFYLHFHYNGWFIFGMFALLHRLFEKEGISYNKPLSIRQLQLMCIAILPTYLLSLPQLAFPRWVQWIALTASLLQCLAVGLLVYQLYAIFKQQKNKRDTWQAWILTLSISALFIKEICQLLGALPDAFGFQLHLNHFLLIAYLHLLFLGSITPFLFFIFSKYGWLNIGEKTTKIALLLYLAGVVASELYLFLLGLQLPLNFSFLPYPVNVLFVASLLIAMGICGLTFTNRIRNGA